MNGIIVLTACALVLSIIIVIIDFKMNSVNKKEEEIIKLLPGYNCNACGYGGCKGMAGAILKDKKAYLKCRPLKEEQKKNLEEYLSDN